MRLKYLLFVVFAACSNQRPAAEKTSQCRINYQRNWDTREPIPTDHEIYQTYNTLSHALYYRRTQGTELEIWISYKTYCEPCVSQLPTYITNADLFPNAMVLPLKVIDCFYFVDADNREWHSPIEAKLAVEILRDPLRQGPPPDQILEWPPRKR